MQGLLGLLPDVRGYGGFYYRDANGVGHYGLEGLSMDILEKVKRASGYPLDVNLYANMRKCALVRVGTGRELTEGSFSFGSNQRVPDEADTVQVRVREEGRQRLEVPVSGRRCDLPRCGGQVPGI